MAHPLNSWVYEELKKSVDNFNKMKEAENMKEQTKAELTDAGYRVAANQSIKLTHGAIISALRAAGHDSERIKSLTNLLNTEYGKSLLSLAIGMGISQTASESPRTQRMGKELRIGGMASAGNEIVSSVMDAVWETLTSSSIEEGVQERIAEMKQDTLHFQEINDEANRLDSKTG